MKTQLLITTVLSLSIVACGGSGGGGGGDSSVPNETTPTTPPTTPPPPEPEPEFEMTTGFVDGDPISSETTDYLAMEFDHPDGKVIAFVGASDAELIEDGRVFEATLYTDASYHIFSEFLDQPELVRVYGDEAEDVDGIIVGYGDVFSVAAAGLDGAGNPFAISSFNYDPVINSGDLSAPSDSEQVEFTGVNYGYLYIDTGSDEITRVFGSDGEVTLNNGALTGSFDEGQLTFLGNLEGVDIVDGESILIVDGASFPGDVQGAVDVWNDGQGGQTYYTDGAFVSSDETDVILYSGGWTGSSSN